jgi:hypothetical protein
MAKGPDFGFTCKEAVPLKSDELKVPIYPDSSGKLWRRFALLILYKC